MEQLVKMKERNFSSKNKIRMLKFNLKLKIG